MVSTRFKSGFRIAFWRFPPELSSDFKSLNLTLIPNRDNPESGPQGRVLPSVKGFKFRVLRLAHEPEDTFLRPIVCEWG